MEAASATEQAGSEKKVGLQEFLKEVDVDCDLLKVWATEGPQALFDEMARKGFVLKNPEHAKALKTCNLGVIKRALDQEAALESFDYESVDFSGHQVHPLGPCWVLVKS